VISWFQKFAFSNATCYRYDRASTKLMLENQVKPPAPAPVKEEEEEAEGKEVDLDAAEKALE
jgi:hypothetical protein